MILPSRPGMCAAVSVVVIVAADCAAAQIAPPTPPSCPCGPSALPSYVPAPRPAVRPLDYSPRSGSGVTVRDGDRYRPARTDLGSSSAAPVIGPALWSGLYAGAHGGYQWGSTGIVDPALGTIQSSGAFGGVHLGVNVQHGALVLGVEGDIAVSRASGRRSIGSGIDVETDRNWTGSFRARGGFAFDNALLYVTGGAALAEQRTTLVSGGTAANGKSRFPGFVLGGGLDWKLMPNVSLRGEVLHYRFGNRQLDFGGLTVPVRLDETVVRAGVSYHFN